MVFAAVYAGFAAAGSGLTLAALFAAYGLYIAATEGTSKALIGRAIPTGERASALGLYSTATGLATFAASTLGGLLWSAYGAWATFVYGAAAALVAAALMLAGRGRVRRALAADASAGADPGRRRRLISRGRRQDPLSGRPPTRIRCALTVRPTILEGGMAQTCAACGRANDEDAGFCQQCGAQLAAPAQPELPVAPAPCRPRRRRLR